MINFWFRWGISTSLFHDNVRTGLNTGTSATRLRTKVSPTLCGMYGSFSIVGMALTTALAKCAASMFSCRYPIPARIKVGLRPN
jgi:hypothetical protein